MADPGQLFAASLADGRIESPSASLVVVEWTAPGAAGERPGYIAPLHIHHGDDEAWYVLDGSLGVRLSDRDLEVSAGGCVLAPRGTPHTYWNAASEPARYVLVMTRRISALISALHAPGAPTDSASMAATFAEYESEYLGWPES